MVEIVFANATTFDSTENSIPSTYRSQTSVYLFCIQATANGWQFWWINNNFTGEKYTKKSVLLKSQIIFTMLYFHINHCNNSVLTRMSSDTD